MEAKLGREISDRFRNLTTSAFFAIGVLAREILLVSADRPPPDRAGKLHPSPPRPAGPGAKLEHPDRIVIGPIPKLGIEMAEKPARRWLPGPPKIENHLTERFELRGQIWNDVISLDVRHEEKSVPRTEAEYWQQND